MKTVRDVVEPGERIEFDGRTVIVLADDDPILDYPVIEPSGVVLAVDREKLVAAIPDDAVVLVTGHNHASALDHVSVVFHKSRIVDAILTSLAEDGFREVEEVVTLDDDCGGYTKGRVKYGACKGDEVAFLKPLPPAKED